jgi:hypothetical protein
MIPVLNLRGHKEKKLKGTDTLEQTTNGEGNYDTEVSRDTL